MTSPPVPPQAITAAAVAIHDVDCPDTRCSGSALGHCHKLARAALEAAAPHLAAAERAGLCEVLAGHYLAAMTCDHDEKRDRPECACSLVDLGWHPSVGEAVQAWIRHVMWQRSADLLGQP